MILKLLNEHHLEFLRLKGGCTGSSESTHVKMSHCWKSHATAQMWGLSVNKRNKHCLIDLPYITKVVVLGRQQCHRILRCKCLCGNGDSF